MNIQKVKLTDVKNNPDNPRILKDDKFAKLVNSINEFPQMLEIRPIVVNEDNIVLGGNMRLKACKEAGLTDIYIIKANDLTPEQQKEFIIKDNVGYGEWDMEILAQDWDMEKLEDWGLDVEFEVVDEQEAEEDDFEVDEGIETDIVAGDLFEIGDHRLLCGDSTNVDDVEKLMNGEKADMVFTDPPYGVSMSRSLVSGKDNSIKNDNLNDEEFSLFLNDVFGNIKINTKDNANIYLWIGFRKYSLCEVIFNKYFSTTNCIVWAKPSIGLGKKGYRLQHELCIFSGEIESNSLSDLWEYGRDREGLHPTMKPIDLVSRGVTDSSNKDSIVLDLFGGSGSTMVACHQLKRKCYMSELDPKYVQTIINRMIKLDQTLEIKRNGKPYASK